LRPTGKGWGERLKKGKDDKANAGGKAKGVASTTTAVR
jgi:hypothetical protein